MLLLAIIALLQQLGCMSSNSPKQRTLNEWGKLSRPKF